MQPNAALAGKHFSVRTPQPLGWHKKMAGPQGFVAADSRRKQLRRNTRRGGLRTISVYTPISLALSAFNVFIEQRSLEGLGSKADNTPNIFDGVYPWETFYSGDLKVPSFGQSGLSAILHQSTLLVSETSLSWGKHGHIYTAHQCGECRVDMCPRHITAKRDAHD